MGDWRAKNAGVPTGVPVVGELPVTWICVKSVGGVSSTATFGDKLPNPGDFVACTPTDVNPTCDAIRIFGYAALFNVGGGTSGTSSCVTLSKTLSFLTPGGGVDSQTGTGAFPLRCAVTWGSPHDNDDWWHQCTANVP